MCDDDFTIKDIQLLSCGTTSPDQLMPSHSSMVHGLLAGSGNIELNTASGACCSGMNALKYGFMAVKAGIVDNSVCVGSERTSTMMNSDKFEKEVEHLIELEEQPVLAFKKDFLRWMLSDGAGAFLLQDKPGKNLSLRIEWMEAFSYADELEACMYYGGDKLEDGSIKSWTEFKTTDWIDSSIFAMKQDVKLLGENILVKAADSLKKAMEKNNILPSDVTYYLPHISSYYFKEGLYDAIKDQNIEIPWEKWFMNLSKVGNVGAASIYLMVEELANSGKLKKGDKILLTVPESARFSYVHWYLTVC